MTLPHKNRRNQFIAYKSCSAIINFNSHEPHCILIIIYIKKKQFIPKIPIHFQVMVTEIHTRIQGRFNFRKNRKPVFFIRLLFFFISTSYSSYTHT